MGANQGVNGILGQRVKELRRQLGCTREQLAEQIGVSTRFLADVESGKVGVSLGTLTKLCRALYTSADYLLGMAQLNQEQRDYMEVQRRVQQIPAEYLAPFLKITDAYLQALCKKGE